MKKQTRNDTRWRVQQDEPSGSVTLTEEPVLRGNRVQATLAERGYSHGDYSVDATTAMEIVDLLETFESFSNFDPVKRHALTMIAFKIARILTGDPNHKDHWHDIAGYATLVEDRCE